MECSQRTIPDPELGPDSGEVLYFVLVELDFSNIQEVARVCNIELKGGIDKSGLKEFVKARVYVIYVESLSPSLRVREANGLNALDTNAV